MSDEKQGNNFDNDEMEYYGRLSPIHQALLPALFTTKDMQKKRIIQIKNEIAPLIHSDKYSDNEQTEALKRERFMVGVRGSVKKELSILALLNLIFPYECLQQTQNATGSLITKYISRESINLRCNLYPWQISTMGANIKDVKKRKIKGQSDYQFYSELPYEIKAKALIGNDEFRIWVNKYSKPIRIGRNRPFSKGLKNMVEIWDSYLSKEHIKLVLKIPRRETHEYHLFKQLIEVFQNGDKNKFPSKYEELWEVAFSNDAKLRNYIRDRNKDKWGVNKSFVDANGIERKESWFRQYVSSKFDQIA